MVVTGQVISKYGLVWGILDQWDQLSVGGSGIVMEKEHPNCGLVLSAQAAQGNAMGKDWTTVPEVRDIAPR